MPLFRFRSIAVVSIAASVSLPVVALPPNSSASRPRNPWSHAHRPNDGWPATLVTLRDGCSDGAVPGYVFVSYSRRDKTYTMDLVRHLRAAGAEVWVDTEIHYGSQWENEIRRRIEGAAAMVVVMTPDSAGSDHVGNELAWARKLKIPVFPVLLSGEEFYAVAGRHYFDAHDGRLPDRRFLEDLARAADGPPPAGVAARRRYRLVAPAAAAVALIGGATAYALNDRSNTPGTTATPSPAYTGALLRDGYLGQVVSTDGPIAEGPRCIEALGGLAEAGAGVGRSPCGPGDRQELIALHPGGQDRTRWKLQFKHAPDLCLAVTADERVVDRRLVLDHCASAPAWRFEDWGESTNGNDRYWQIHYAGADEFCVARPVAAPHQDTTLRLEVCDKKSGHLAQQWRAHDQRR
ncbi:TIR domain-containing protein [Actinoplanes sp. URMC 104]|uniref:TIR domain-containing protein n=1 Tax=Actinoplanes sp. URMC 104 TaxID=3423409 RepID=UPI003F1D6EEC